MQKGQTSKIYFPNLDGFRFLSFFAVFLRHCFVTDHQYILNDGTYQFIKYKVFFNGNLGVNFFFVLSGFLITYLLLKEKTDFNRVSIPKFYLRRTLKIWPLFYFVVFFGFVVFPFIKSYLGETPKEPAVLWTYLTFTNNFDLIKHGTDSSTLSVLWSIAVEEQFYLVWPLVIGFLRPRYLPFAFVLIIIGSYIFRLPYTEHQYETTFHYHSLSCMSDLTIGAFGAWLSFYSSRFLSFFQGLKRPVIITIYLITAVCFFLKQYIFTGSPYWVASSRLIISLLFVFILLEQNYSQNSFFKMGQFKRLSKLGEYTYGLYCLHMIGILVAAIGLRMLNLNTSLWQLFIIEGGLSLILSIGLAYISFHYYEKPFLNLKKKFAKVKTTKPDAIEREQQGGGITATVSNKYAAIQGKNDNSNKDH